MLERSSPKSILELYALHKATSLSPAQVRAEALVTSFVDSVTDGYSLTAMVGGGLVYRLGRIGTLALGSRLFSVRALREAPLLSSLVRYGSVGVGFAGEVFTFEAGQRALRIAIGGADPALLNWSGENGLGRGLLSAALSLGSLKGAGALVQGQNLILQHLFQDSAMVLAHKVCERILPGRGDSRIAPTWVEQFVNAEATLWQMDAGMSLIHGTFPTLRQVERSLEISVRSREINRIQTAKKTGPQTQKSLLTLTTLGAGLATLLGSPDAQAAMERVGAGDFNTLEVGLTAFALGAIFSRLSDWVKNLRKTPEPDLVDPPPLSRPDLPKVQEEPPQRKFFPLRVYRKFAHRQGWDFLLVMGHVLREAPASVVRDFIDQQFTQNPVDQLTWLENYRVEAGKEILADTEAFIQRAASKRGFSQKQLLEIRTKAAEVLYGVGEKKRAMDYLHQVFSDLTKGVPWVEFYPQDGDGNFILMEPPQKEIFLRLIGKDIYPYFLGRLDPDMNIGQKLVQDYHEEKKKFLPRDFSAVQRHFLQGWVSLISIRFLRDADRIQLAREITEAHGKEKLISELRGLLKEAHNAPVAARLLDHLDPEWDRPLRKLKIPTSKQKGRP